MKILTFERVPVYDRNPTRTKQGKTNISKFKGKKGVYKIFENRKLIYVGNSTSDLYKTIIRHFQKWTDPQQPKRLSYRSRLSKNDYRVEVSLIEKDSDIFNLEAILINKHKPRDNKDELIGKFNNKFGKDYFNQCVECYNKSLDKKEPVRKTDYIDESGVLRSANGEVIF